MEENLGNQRAEKLYILPASIILSALLVSGAIISVYGDNGKVVKSRINETEIKEIVVQIEIGNLGKKLTDAEVIDRETFEDLYRASGKLEEAQRLFKESEEKIIAVNSENAGMMLNFLWALGLGQKSAIYERGAFADKNTAGSFASTGGWTIAKGGALDHLGKHEFVLLTMEQEILVEKIAQNIYRPCCNNPTSMPDCNHGMAMLGLIELLVSQGKNEDNIYDIALVVNTLWFPDHYSLVNDYLQKSSLSLMVTPKEILGYSLSSAEAGQNIIRKMSPTQSPFGSSCSV